MRIVVRIDRQRLDIVEAGTLAFSCPVSTAANGPGEGYGSQCTPRGLHVVRAKVGAGCAPNTVFVRRRATGEVWTPSLAAEHPGRDWMLTRILWLSGREGGFNRGGNVDSLRRKIYVHGTGDEASLGAPRSHGCIRVSNADVIELFDLVRTGAEVDIVEDSALPYAVRVVTWDAERERLREIRNEVFVIEQRVPPELESDAADAASRHALALAADGLGVGCARLLPDGSLGRVAVRRSWRGRGVGSALLLRLVDVARYAGCERVALNARSDACDFYVRHGFAARGDEFTEAGIRHRRMERPLQEGA